MKKTATRVLLVDDHPIVRQGLAQLIGQQAGLEVCAEAADPQEAMAAIKAHSPSLVVLDLSLNGADGMELIRDIRQQREDLPVLVLSMHDESVYAQRAIRAGARGYIMKQEPPEVLLEAVRRVLDGEIYLSEKLGQSLLTRLVGATAPAAEQELDQLSDRELQVVRLIGQGLRTRDIAEQLYLSVKTVEAHREHIKQKLGLGSGAELLRYAVEMALRET